MEPQSPFDRAYGQAVQANADILLLQKDQVPWPEHKPVRNKRGGMDYEITKKDKEQFLKDVIHKVVAMNSAGKDVHGLEQYYKGLSKWAEAEVRSAEKEISSVAQKVIGPAAKNPNKTGRG